jgi:CBS domain-containing protein
MEEIVRFLLEHPPFSQLPLLQIQRIAGAIQIEYFGQGVQILVQGGKPAAFLYIVRRGSVDLLRERDGVVELTDTMSEGECFGYVSLIQGKPPISTVRAREATLCYLLPAALFHQLRRDYPSFAQFFARSITERLEQALQQRHATAAPELFQTRLQDLITEPLVVVPPNTTILEAARRMRDAQASALIVDLPPYGMLDAGSGIVTDSDLRNRVVAEGLDYSTPIAHVMSAPAITVPADSLVFEGLLKMIEHGVRHLALSRDGQIIGIVNYRDFLRLQSNNPLLMPQRLALAHSEADLRAYTEQVTATVGGLLDAGARVSDIGRAVAAAHDALLVHIIRDAEAALGPPPCPYAWLVLGSEGRYEQTLRTDQDNALIYADNAPEEAEAYFTALAERVVEQLVRCGFPRCPGNVMATNPQWRQPRAVWQNYFRQWISVPDEEALFRTAIFFDLRSVYGTLDIEASLRPIILRARDNRVFLGRLARAALRQTAPINFFRQLVLERRGDQRGLIDLKYRGTAMIVDLARLFALEAGVPDTNTIARLRKAANHSSLGETSAEELIAAFELIGLLRLRWQYQQLRQGLEPGNQVEVDKLTPLERRELKEALRAVAVVQRAVAATYQTNMLA